MWDLATAEVLLSTRGDTGPVEGVAVAPDERLALALDGPGVVTDWDVPPH